MWTSEMVKNKLHRDCNMNAYGHSWLHFNMTSEQMFKRMKDENKTNVSSFTVDKNILENDFLITIDDWSEDIADWLNDNDFSEENLKISMFHEFDNVIGNVISKEKWSNKNEVYQGSLLIIVLKKYITKTNDVNFKIITYEK